MKSCTRTGPRLALAAALTFSMTGTALAASDAWITTKTKMALLTTEGASATDVSVDTTDGRVTLHGKVATDAEKAKAAEVARGIDGTRTVRNLLQVVPESATRSTDVKDAQLEKNVEAALASDAQLSGSQVDVKSVNRGVVLLAGKANSLTAHLSAVTTTSRVPGVRRVASEIESPDEVADSQVRRMEGSTATVDTRSLSGTVSDAWITSETKMRLMADGDTPALDINVDTERGVVTLFGIVASDPQRKAAEANAVKVSGVKSVRNQLEVVPSSKQDAVAAKDEDLEKAVETAIAGRESLASSGIDVEVKNGIVRLTGEVPSESDRLTAAVIARSTPGVRSVLPDDLKVKSQQS